MGLTHIVENEDVIQGIIINHYHHYHIYVYFFFNKNIDTFFNFLKKKKT